MSNPKVFEYAKEVGMTPLALMDKIREWQLPVKSHMAELPPDVLAQIKTRLSGGGDQPVEEAPKKKATTRRAPAKKAAAKTAPDTPAAVAAASAAEKSAAKATVVRRRGAVAANTLASELKAENEAAEAAEEITDSAETAREAEEAAPSPEAEAASPASPAVPEPAVVTPPPAAAAAPSVASEPEKPEARPVAAAPAPARKKEVVVGSSGVASSPAPAPVRRNIVGRMDLSRVQPPPGARGGFGPRPAGGPGGGGGFGAGSRPAAGRGLRAGFVAAATPEPLPPIGGHGFDESRKRLIDRKAKSSEGGAAKEKEGEQEQFNAVEFRKRELVFQPKKKKVLVGREAQRTQLTQPKASKRVLKVNGTMKVSDAAQEMGLKGVQLIKVLMQNGVMATVNTDLDYETLALIVPEFGWEAQNVLKTAQDVLVETAFGDLQAEKIVRPPVVTIMGHVDHGKTSLLDAIRSAKVAAGEAGGITQHIGAYSVTLDDGAQITFLDTPGHEAFTAMRARGANATDIAVIVVAADDGMMPQTQEAVSHAKAAGVPIIVAVNKMDKPGANPDKIKQQLTEMELVPEEWGGSTIYAPVSALKKTGINELLEQIKVVAELAELKANPLRSGTGIVIEAKMEKGKGPVATLLVKDGTVKVGQSIVAGTSRGRVRSLTNDRGERVNEVGPGFPAEVLGLDAVPAAGDQFDVVKDEETAERVAGIRQETQDKANAASNKKLSLEDIFSKVTQGDVKELNIILKADVHGSVEAIQGMIAKLSTPEVKARILHTAVGGINESDVLLAHTAKGIVIGFNVRPDTNAQAKAKQLGVDVRSYTIVYELVDDLKKAMSGLLTPDIVEKVIGRAEVRNVFTVPKIGAIAGSFVVDGKVQRSNQVRLIRDGKIVLEGKIGSLKRFKDDAKEVAQGFECGIGIENFNDVKVGDVIEAFVKEEIARDLDAGPRA
ncbi:MAG: translation initiation factor IF-2 [Bdellovibrionaceae bacterium]|nr:translation initiation factor IF-2 [Pseudobdellovibrionaceae bacterium]